MKKQEFNIIEVLTSENMKLTFDNSLKQLAQHLDAQYKNTQDDNICIFKSIPINEVGSNDLLFYFRAIKSLPFQKDIKCRKNK